MRRDDDDGRWYPDEPPDAPDLVADDVAAIVRAGLSHGTRSIRRGPTVPVRTAVHVSAVLDDADAESGPGRVRGASGDGVRRDGAASRHRNAPGDRDGPDGHGQPVTGGDGDPRTRPDIAA